MKSLKPWQICKRTVLEICVLDWLDAPAAQGLEEEMA